MNRHFLVFGAIALALFVTAIFLARDKRDDGAVLSSTDVAVAQIPEERASIRVEENSTNPEQPALKDNITPHASSMKELEDGISRIEQEIAEGDLLTRANSAALSEEELMRFRKLLRERDQLFAAKVELLLNELQ